MICNKGLTATAITKGLTATAKGLTAIAITKGLTAKGLTPIAVT